MTMPLPEFKKMTQDKTAVPEWTKYFKDGDFVSYSVTYKTKIYFDLFDECVFHCGETGDIKYYIYDPVKHGADENRKYPVLMFLHGASNSLMGIDCIMCCGAEQFASPEYQSKMGGAYIIAPIANEKRLPNGRIEGTWGDFDIPYHIPVKGIFDRVKDEYSENTGSKIVLGASSGGAFTWKLLEEYPDYFDAAMPIAAAYTLNEQALDKLAKIKTKILVAHGRHDEMVEYDKCVKPCLRKLESMKNVVLFLPEWVYNGDGGIASVFYGSEMGQHCMINWIQANIMFDNGKPADERFPNGITGWVKSICEDN